MAQPGLTTERACDRCRERRVKCDKRLPSCLRCEKLGKLCPGYDKKRKFVDEGVSLRKKYQESKNASLTDVQGTDSSDGGPQSFSDATILSPGSQYDTQLRGSSSLAVGTLSGLPVVTQSSTGIASQETGHNQFKQPSVSFDPVADSILTQSKTYPVIEYRDCNAEEIWQEGTFDPEWFNLEPDTYYSIGGNSCGFLPNLPNIVDEVDKKNLGAVGCIENLEQLTGISSLPESSNVWASESQYHTSAIITDEREHEMAYLIRHFTESIGPWMDLFDQGRHFGHLVPLKALRDALLRNAIAAVAAKQLGLVKGHKPFTGTQAQKPAAMEVINVLEVDWFYKAANYYDKAITFSRAYLSALSGSLSNPSTPNSQTTVLGTTSDDLLVAVSIFSLYESLDKLEIGWLQHLAGLKSLLSAVGANKSNHGPGQLVSSNTLGRQAAFWNFARADYQAAYANHRKTLLDPNDLNLWRNCGLQLQDDGALYAMPSEMIKSDLLRGHEIAQLVSHTILWLVLSVMNYLANDLNEAADARLATWTRLSLQLDSWETNLPETFQPCAQMRYQHPARLNRSARSHLKEVFFSINQCAAAVQLYHFARILLLLNKPSLNSGLSRLRAYREVSSEAIKHAREICGIALGRPHPSVRVEMLLPLYIAGTCLEDDDERLVVLDLLKAIEKDTGCATDMKVQSLIAEWGWGKEPQEVP